MQLRKDYVLNRWVIISEKRGIRPKQFSTTHETKPDIDYFAVGNEHLTPPEIGRIPHPKNPSLWTMRWFNNKFPAVDMSVSATFDTSSPLFIKGGAFGEHEIVVETEDVSKQIFDLSAEELSTLFRIFQQRITELSKRKEVAFVQVFKNHGAKGGTSLIHSHTQIVSMNIIPSLIEDKIHLSHIDGNCRYCQVVHDESFSDRKIKETEHFLSFCPWASQYNYEAWVFPKQHIKTFTELHDNLRKELADHLSLILTKLKELNCSFNFYIHYAPQGKDLHMHLVITPRLATWAGFELGTDIIINSIPPESAAAFYRGEIALEKGK